MSERKSGTGGAAGTMVHRLDATRISPSYDNILQTDTWHDQMAILYYEIHSFRIIYVPGCNNMFDYVADFAERITFAEHGKLVAESSEFHLTLSRAHRAHFFQLEIRKKAGHFKWKAGKRDGAKIAWVYARQR